MGSVALTFAGTATTILEMGGLRLLTDPVFGAPGANYPAVPGPLESWPRYTRLAPSALQPAAVGPIDAVLLSHDQHGDNLDAEGLALLPGAGVVLTTPEAARRLARRGLSNVIGVEPGGIHRLGDVEVLASPARHGPPGSRWLTGPVTGFFLRSRDVSVYVSGDTVMHGALARFARDHVPDLALVHVGAARILGVRFTAHAADLVALSRLWPEAVLAPIHFDGWSHFSEGRAALERRLERAGLGPRLRWLPPGVRVSLEI